MGGKYDGEWIEASTPELVLPYAHQTFMEMCLRKVSNFLGFPSYGNVTMFIERNSAHVGFTLGPFKSGTMLSHKMVVTQDQTRSTNNGERPNVMLMDEVTIMNNNADGSSDANEYYYHDKEIEDGWIGCSCFESVLDVSRSWYKASLDCYVDQTKTSLRNLVDLIERGGEMNAHQSNGRLGYVSHSKAAVSACYISDPMSVSTSDQREPLLS